MQKIVFYVLAGFLLISNLFSLKANAEESTLPIYECEITINQSHKFMDNPAYGTGACKEFFTGWYNNIYGIYEMEGASLGIKTVKNGDVWTDELVPISVGKSGYSIVKIKVHIDNKSTATKQPAKKQNNNETTKKKDNNTNKNNQNNQAKKKPQPPKNYTVNELKEKKAKVVEENGRYFAIIDNSKKEITKQQSDEIKGVTTNEKAEKQTEQDNTNENKEKQSETKPNTNETKQSDIDAKKEINKDKKVKQEKEETNWIPLWISLIILIGGGIGYYVIYQSKQSDKEKDK